MLYSQPRLLEKGTKKPLVLTDAVERIVNQTVEFPYVSRSHIMKLGIFTIAPELFGGIKLRGIARKPFRFNLPGMPFEILPQQFGVMNRPIIENKNNLTGNTPSKETDEAKDSMSIDIVLEDLKVEPDAFSSGRKGDGADDREPIAFIRLNKDGRFTFNRPSLSDDGLEHKARFINENDRLFFPSWPVSLSSAKSRFAILLRPGNLAPAPPVLVSDNSNPLPALSSRRGKNDNLSRIPSRLPWRSSLTSTSDPRSHMIPDLSKAASPASVFAAKTASAAGLRASWALNLSSPPFLSSPSNRLSMIWNTQDAQPLPGSLSLASPALRHAVFALPIALDFPVVSCLILYISSLNSANVNNTY